MRDYSTLVNPYFPTPALFQSFRNRLETILRADPSSPEEMARLLAEHVGVAPESILLGNGATELIGWVNRLLVTESLAVPVPTFGRWLRDPALSDKTFYAIESPPEQGFQLTPGDLMAGVLRNGARAAVLSNPNNPTGALMPRADVLRVLEKLADLEVVVVDESFIDFADGPEVPSIERKVARYPNAIVIKSLSASLGLPGLRLGYAVANPDLAGRLRAVLPAWSVSAVAQALIEELPGARADFDEGRRRLVRDRIYLEERLRVVPGMTVYPSQASYVYARLPEGVDGVTVREHLLSAHGCLLRAYGDEMGSDSHHLRIAARPQLEVDYLIGSLEQVLTELGVDAVLGATPPPAVVIPPPVALVPDELPVAGRLAGGLGAPDSVDPAADQKTPPLVAALTAAPVPAVAAAPEPAVAPVVAPPPEAPPPSVPAPPLVEAAAPPPAAAAPRSAAPRAPAAAPSAPAVAPPPAREILFAPVPVPETLRPPRRRGVVAVVVALGAAAAVVGAVRFTRSPGTAAPAPAIIVTTSPAPSAPPAHAPEARAVTPPENAPAVAPPHDVLAVTTPGADQAAARPDPTRDDAGGHGKRRIARSSKSHRRHQRGRLGAHRGATTAR